MSEKIKTLLNNTIDLTVKNPDKNFLDHIKNVLDRSSNIYYNSGLVSKLTDQEFDALFKYYTQFRKYTSGSKVTSNRKVVNVKHLVPEMVGTTYKTNSIEEIRSWFSKHDKELSLNKSVNIDTLISLKYDGNSVVTIFNSNGTLHRALTRGEDGEGADVSKYFDDCSLTITKKLKSLIKDEKTLIAIKNECIVYFDDHKEITHQGKKFANPRSAATGILSGDENIKFKDKLTLVPLSVKIINGKKDINREEELLIMVDDLLPNNQPNMRYDVFQSWKSTSSAYEEYEDIETIYKETIANIRESLNYPIDGLVIEYLNQDYRNSLGRTDDKNNFDVALKFPYMEKKTKIKDITFSIGLTGRVTPVVVFDDLEFNGNINNHVSISDYKRFMKLKLSIGDEVIIQYRNEVLSYLIPSPSNEHKGKPVPFIDKCPVCGTQIVVSGARAFCPNMECPANMAGNIINFFNKLNIKGIKEATVNTLIENNLVKTIPDMYILNRDDLLALPRWGEKSVDNLLNAINSRKEIFDYELFGSIGIPDVSLKTTKEIFKNYTSKELGFNYGDVLNNDNLHKFDEKYSYNKLIKIDGIQDITASKIVEFYSTHISLFVRLSYMFDYINSYKEELSKNKNNNFSGYTFVFSGFRDKDLQEKLENLGNKVTGSVSSKSTILVVKDKSKSTVKMKKAESLDIPIMNQEEFSEYLKKNNI